MYHHFIEAVPKQRAKPKSIFLRILKRFTVSDAATRYGCCAVIAI